MKKTIQTEFDNNHDIVLYLGDCRDLLSGIPDESIDLTVTSPPYYVGKEYDTSTESDAFVDLLKEVFPEILRVTKKGGSICWEVGYHVKKGVVTPLDFLVHTIASMQEGLVLRNRIIWAFGHGLHCKKRFSGRHETILWYTKGDGYNFNLDAVRVPQRYPGKRYYKGNRKGEPSGNPKGKNPSNVWDNIPSVKANHIEKRSHPCQFPIGLAERLVLALSEEGDIVLDPFLGVGSTCCAALLHDRRFWGSEVNKKYYQIAVERCTSTLDGTIKHRPHDKLIYEPDPRTRVARSPFGDSK
ncbi:MAG: site-specific DNA-methyltransferase [Candidatus Aegiribacteria sp.]|nr:site-specific DNA-methyltransferase [Candidatus Aegiribacteria sp.]